MNSLRGDAEDTTIKTLKDVVFIEGFLCRHALSSMYDMKRSWKTLTDGTQFV